MDSEITDTYFIVHEEHALTYADEANADDNRVESADELKRLASKRKVGVSKELQLTGMSQQSSKRICGRELSRTVSADVERYLVIFGGKY